MKHFLFILLALPLCAADLGFVPYNPTNKTVASGLIYTNGTFTGNGAGLTNVSSFRLVDTNGVTAIENSRNLLADDGTPMLDWYSVDGVGMNIILDQNSRVQAIDTVTRHLYDKTGTGRGSVWWNDRQLISTNQKIMLDWSGESGLVGNGSGLTNLNASALFSGTVPPPRVNYDATNLTGVIQVIGSNVGIGTTNPATKLEVAGTATATNFVAGGVGVATTNWVANAIAAASSAGIYFYNSTNLAGTNAFDAGAFVYSLTNVTAFSRTNTGLTSASNGTYFGTVFTPTMVTNPHGPATITIYASATGSGGPAISIKPELYFLLDKTSTNVLFEAQDVPYQSVTIGSTNAYIWTLPFPDQATSWQMRRIKMTGINGTVALAIHGGGTRPGILSISSLGIGGTSATSMQSTNIVWNGLSTAAFTNTVAGRIPITIGGTTYYITVSTNAP